MLCDLYGIAIQLTRAKFHWNWDNQLLNYSQKQFSIWQPSAILNFQPNVTTLRSAYGMSRPSVVCRLSSVLSVVCLRRYCTLGRDFNFLAIFLHCLIVRGLGQFVLKFWAKIRSYCKGSCKSNTRGMKNWRFSTKLSLYHENGIRHGHSYKEKRIGTRLRSIKWCHFQ